MTEIGFGCASLFGLPDSKARRRVLEAAYAFGIRHYDLAPIYGLGRAEPEFAAFARGKQDLVVATKFGIGLTRLGRLAGRMQNPVRKGLRSLSGVEARVKTSGHGPAAGRIGKLLYSRDDGSVAAAKESFAESLRTLKMQRIDWFFMHEPSGSVSADALAVADYLELAMAQGNLGGWGLAGDLSGADTVERALLERASGAQFPYDLLRGRSGPPATTGKYHVTFGILGWTLPRIRQLIAVDRSLRERCEEMMDADLDAPTTLVALIVRDALRHNEDGTLLLSSTSIRNLEIACRAALTPIPNEVEVADLIRSRWGGGNAST